MELTIFHKPSILDSPAFAAKADSFDPSARMQPIGLKTVGPTGVFNNALQSSVVSWYFITQVFQNDFPVNLEERGS